MENDELASVVYSRNSRNSRIGQRVPVTGMEADELAVVWFNGKKALVAYGSTNEILYDDRDFNRWYRERGYGYLTSRESAEMWRDLVLCGGAQELSSWGFEIRGGGGSLLYDTRTGELKRLE